MLDNSSPSECAAVETENYTPSLANPPFAGSLGYEATSKDLQRVTTQLHR